MQKKLIAVAVAGLVSTGAMAQVTMYGVADATLDMVKASGATAAGQDIPRFNRVSTNSSLWGVKGTEDLGGGLTAMFQFESSIGFDSASGTLAVRDSYVGLGGAFGKVLFGNLTGPTRLHGALADVYSGATGIGANSALLGKLGNNSLSGNAADSSIVISPTAGCGRSATCTSAFDTRWKNALAYVSPALGPVTITAVYVANENRTREGLDNTASQRDTKGYDLGVMFKQGPITAGLSVNGAKIGDTAGTKATDTRLFGMFDFGMGTVRGLYDRVKAEDNTGDATQTVYGIGATFNVGSGKIVGQYYKAGDVDSGGKIDGTGAKLFTVGYEHSLSKRTLVKVLVSKLSNDELQAYDYGVNSVGQGFGAAGADLTGFSFGVRHTF